MCRISRIWNKVRVFRKEGSLTTYEVWNNSTILVLYDMLIVYMYIICYHSNVWLLWHHGKIHVHGILHYTINVCIYMHALILHIHTLCNAITCHISVRREVEGSGCALGECSSPS